MHSSTALQLCLPVELCALYYYSVRVQSGKKDELYLQKINIATTNNITAHA